ncbi:MAG: DUF2089 domain-containing protein [Alistipes sp.]|nr:DUF2089 domain-containing protein [Alistipes sp.]MDE6778481.1 DUF2089 domain-containing protein [Alistipes sp.]MDE6857974.1 DUF2089 domain-containing protein [Alistipes sp.]
MEKHRNMPKICPSCGNRLSVRALHCGECDTRVEGDYALPSIMRLSDDDRRFVLDFVLCSGSLKEMARAMSLSYPTVRNRLDDIISQLKSFESNETNR